MSEEEVPSEGQRQNRKNKLVAAIALGKPIAVCARENKVSRRTVFRWAKDPKVKAAVDARRRKVVDHCIGVVTGRVARACLSRRAGSRERPEFFPTPGADATGLAMEVLNLAASDSTGVCQPLAIVPNS